MELFLCIVHLFLFGAVTIGIDLPGDCVVIHEMMECQEFIPSSIPDTVEKVAIITLNSNIPNLAFEDRSWQHVLSLDINTKVSHALRLRNKTFVQLSGLQYLGLHSRQMKYIEKDTFYGLRNLTELDFSGSAELKLETITEAINDIALPRLHKLNLKEIQSLESDAFVTIKRDFIEVITKQQLKELILAGVNVRFEDYRNINMSTVLKILDISNNTYVMDTTLGSILKLLQNVKIINMSNSLLRNTPSFRFEDHTVTSCSTEILGFLYFFRMEEFYANNILQGLEVIDSVFNMTCGHNLKVLHARQNHIGKLNFTFYWQNGSNLQEVDVTSNNISYISPFAMKNMTKLTRLFLGNNSLGHMSKYQEFEDLFQSLGRLEHLDLSNNRLYNLPTNIFGSNKNLKHVSLSRNMLKTVTFQISHLTDLVFLDISFNEIMFLDTSVTGKLGTLLSITNATIDFHGNAIECSCKTEPFIKWLKDNTKQEETNKNIYCGYEQQTIKINDEAVAKTKFLCIRTAIYITVAASVALLVGVSVVALIQRYRIKKRAKERNTLAQFIVDQKA